MINPVAFTITLGNFVKDIYWYGIIIACSMILAMLVAMRNAKKQNLDPEMIMDFFIIAIVFAIIGARTHYVIWCWDLYKNGPFWKIFAIWEGGLAIYGGIAGGVIAAALFSKIRNVKSLKLLDTATPSLILGQAIGRWGNFANQEAYGYQIIQEKFMHFPFAVYIQETGQYHLATFFYESMWNFLGFIVLMLFMRKPRREGKVFSLYLLIYGLGRVFIEAFRTDSQMLLDTGIRINQLISVIIIIVGAVFLIFNRSDKSYTIVEETDSKPSRLKRGNVKPIKPINDKKVDDKTDESVVDEYKAMSDEMRKQRKRTDKDKE